MGTNILTTPGRTLAANSFMNSLTASNGCYFFVGDSTVHTNTTIQSANNDIDDLYYNPYKLMLMGKKIVANGLALAITNYPYVANTIFSMYDDQDQNLVNESFYCVVNSGSFSHVFKCLDNNQGNTSTIQPDFSQIVGSNTVVYQTSDGYRWKYMTTVDNYTVNALATPQFFPLIVNTAVVGSAVNGAIDIVKVIQGGTLYNNWILGSFATSDISIGGNPTILNISNNQIKTVNNYYNSCILYLTSGPGIGQFQIISSYFSNTTGNYIQLANSFPITPTNGTTYQIYPQVAVNGDGNETVEVIARGLVNALASNSIYRVEVLQRGINFQKANAQVIAANVVGVSLNAIVRPILPPSGGHGSNPVNELNANNVIISVQLNESESNTIPFTNQYQQIGIVKDPLFSNVHITLNSSTGNFLVGETMYIMNPIQIQANCSVQIANNVVVGPTDASLLQLTSNAPVLFISSDGTASQLNYVNSVTNSSYMTLKSNSNFACSSTFVYNPQIYGSAIVSLGNNVIDFFVNNCPGILGTGSFVIGATSGAYGNVLTLARNDVSKGFSTFVQLNKYSITLLSGTFIQNETVMQGNVSGLYFSGDTASVNLTNLNGVISLTGGNLVGQQSGAIASISKIYQPELLFNSGQILYLENITPIVRQNNEVEYFKIVLNF